MIKKYLILLIICLANAWIWKVFGGSPLLGITLIFISFLLAFNLKISSLILLAILGTFLLKNSFDVNLLHVSSLEKDRLEHKYEYYAQGLGKIYRNRIGIYLHYNVFPYTSRFLRNIAYNTDPNLYFFANHPRERSVAAEFEKFSFILFPFFIIGLISIFVGSFGFLIFYFILSLLISAFVSPGYNLGPILIFPFIVTVLYLGVLKVFKKWI